MFIVNTWTEEHRTGSSVEGEITNTLPLQEVNIMTSREQMAIKIGTKVAQEIMQAESRGENNMMIGLRLSGIVKGLEIAGVLTSEEATQMIINMKNEFNF